MARHFAGSDGDLVTADRLGELHGYVESEFPLFPYLTGQIYQLLGVHEWIGRGLSVLFSALTIGLSSDWVDAGSIRRPGGGVAWPQPWHHSVCITAASFKKAALLLLCAAGGGSPQHLG